MTMLPAVDIEAFTYYHMIHRYNQKFGLPHGKGWIDELPWVPQFLAYFDDLRLMIESWQVKSASHSGGGDITPGMLS